MRYRSSVSALLALLLAGLAGIGLAHVLLRKDDEAQPVLVDERAGVLHGVRFGDSEREVRALIGEETDHRDGYFPAGADHTGPVAIPSPASDRGSRIPPSQLHYDRTAYLVSPTACVFSMATFEKGARTRASVGVGDELALVRERYDRVECGAAVAGEALIGESPTYRWCKTRVGEVRIFLGGDPIESITLTSYGR
ncbi:hypothetical protein BH20ACT14_BH20ACT14_16510 [soil metagenome]